MTTPHEELFKISREHLFEKKVLLASSHQEGAAFFKSAAQKGYPLFNVSGMTILALAQNILQSDLARQKHAPQKEMISGKTSRQVIFAVLQNLQEANELKYFERLKPTITLSRMIYNALYELLMGEIDMNSIELVSPAKKEDMIQIYHRYLNYLEQNNWLDEPSVISLAKDITKDITKDIARDSTQQLTKEEKNVKEIDIEGKNVLTDIFHPLYFMTDDCYKNLTFVEKALLKNLPEANLFFLSDPLNAIEKASPGYYTHTEKPGFYLPTQQKTQGRELPNVDFCKAYGETDEIKWVFSCIKKSELPLDKVTVLYTSTSPYSELFYQFTAHFGFPCTFGEGTSVYHTKPGRLFYMFLNWMRSDFQAIKFSALMSENLMTLQPEGLTPFKVRRMLREAGVGWSRERYLSMLEAKITSLKQQKEKGQESVPGWVQKELNQYRALYNWFEELFALLPAFETTEGDFEKSVPLSRLAGGLKGVIKNYARQSTPVDKEAQEKLLEEMDVIINVAESRLALSDALDLLKDNISNLRVDRSNPAPGQLHIDHYLNGRSKLRNHVFLVGLDGDRFPGKKREDPILLDEERKNLSSDLPLQRETIDRNQKEMQRLLLHPARSLCISYASFDTMEQREKFPSPLILSIYRAVFDEPEADYTSLDEYLNAHKRQFPSPHEESGIFSEKDVWLYLYRTNSNIRAHGPAFDQAKIISHYPHWQQGLQAQTRRLSEAFTSYDGNIGGSTTSPLYASTSGNGHYSEPVQAPNKNDPRDITVVSPTRLECLASCPFAYFLRYVLRVDPPEEVEYDPSAWLDALTRGKLLHSIFEDFYREIINRSDLPIKAEHANALRQTANAWILDQRRELPPPSELVYSYEAAELLLSVQVFLQSEIEYAEMSQPVFLEFFLDRVPLALPSGREIYIVGKIDRVDKDREGNFLALDYKTGSTYNYSEQKYYRGGRQLQHALYALALEEKLREMYPEADIAVSGGGYIFPTVKGEGARYIRSYQFEDKEAFLHLLDALLALIERGDFVPTDHEDDCKFCDYHVVCERERYKDALEWIHQNEPELELLRQVRDYE